MHIVFNANADGKLRKGPNSACFVQVNHLLLAKSYEKNFGRTIFWSGRNDFELGRNDSRRNGPVSNDRNSEVII